MKPISQFVLSKMFNDIPNLEKAINCLNESMQDRFIETMVGVNIDDSILPKRIKRNDVVYSIKSANYIRDEITAEYIGTDIRYFSNQDDADKFAKTGDYNYNNTTRIANETCTIKGEYTSKKETWFSYDTWMNSEVVVEDNE